MLGRKDNPPYYISAYALACKKGFRGTEEEWLESLTAYGDAVKLGFKGTREEWLASLKGEPGNTGKSAYEYAVEGGFQGSEEAFREQQAHSGKSAYEYAVDGGYTGSVDDFYRKLATEYIAVSGGIMKGNLSMDGHKISDLSDPEGDRDAVPKKYVEAVRTLAQEGKTMAGKAMPKSGGTMSGSIDMGGNKVTGLGTPAEAGDAANKGYVDAYVDGKHWVGSVTLPVDGWVGLVQTVEVPGILATDTPHYGVVYSGTAEEKGLQKEGFALVDDLDTGAGNVTFTCFEEAPEVDLTIQLEVNR